MVYPYTKQSWIAATARLFFRSGDGSARKEAGRLPIQDALPSSLSISALSVLLYLNGIFLFDIK